MQQRYLVLTASMGAGHDQVADELARRLRRQGADSQVVDLLQVLPAHIGPALRRGYAWMLRSAPWLYDLIYRVFFVPRDHVQPSTSPLVMLAASRLAPVIRDYRPTVVVSTFHLAGQVTGRLRASGRLDAIAAVVVTEAVAHALWLDAGNDLFLTLFPALAEQAAERTGKPALAPGPVVDERFLLGADPCRGARRLGLGDGDQAVIVSTGSWGVGSAEHIASELVGLPGIRPVVLCGQNEALQTAAGRVPGAIALGWRDDLPDIFAAATVLIDNAGGSMCLEALASGLPVIAHRPIPGHGGPAVAALAAAGLAAWAGDDDALRAHVERLRHPGADRAALVEAGRAIFAADPAAVLADWVQDRCR